MLTLNELIKIGEWAKQFTKGFRFSFVQGFEGRYVIVEWKDCPEGRLVYHIDEILAEMEENSDEKEGE